MTADELIEMLQSNGVPGELVKDQTPPMSYGESGEVNDRLFIILTDLGKEGPHVMVSQYGSIGERTTIGGFAHDRVSRGVIEVTKGDEAELLSAIETSVQAALAD